MKCPHCSSQLGSKDRFCKHCGKRVERPTAQPPAPSFCGQCGAKLPGQARFCPECGTAVSHPDEAPSARPTGQSAPTGAQGLLEQFKEAVRSGAREEAMDIMKSYLDSRPEDPLAWVLLGDAWRDWDQDDAAADAYSTALSLDPNMARAHTALGILARRRDDDDQAMEHYRQAVAVNPRYGQAYSSMAVIEMRRGDNLKAVEYAEKAWELDRKDPVLAANLAVVYHNLSRFDDRDRMYEHARRLGYASMDGLDQLFRGELTI